MADVKIGRVVDKELISPTLMRFRLAPEADGQFPSYEAGQYIALRRDDCKLTRKTGAGPDGKPTYEPELDPWGRQTVGPVTRSYSIASAPSDTTEHGWLEFLVALEHGVHGLPGRLSEVLFKMSEETGCEVKYHDRITGTFTMAARADGVDSVLMVGTGTGVAPFVSMVQELHVRGGGEDTRRFTLVHTNRTEDELGYHETLFEIEAAGRFDFTYVPTISRPSRDTRDKRIGQGRASNVVRYIYGLPTTEEEKHTGARNEVTRTAAEIGLEHLVHPVLPSQISVAALLGRLEPSTTVLLTCGNPSSMADIKSTASRRQVRFEQEEW